MNQKPPAWEQMPESQRDYKRAQFFRELNRQRNECGFIVRGRELELLVCFTLSSRPLGWFTPARRTWVDDIWKREGDAVGMRFPGLPPIKLNNQDAKAPR